MTRSVWFCLLYDPLKQGFIFFKRNIISKRKHIVDADIVSDVTYMRQVLVYVWSYDFCLACEAEARHMYCFSGGVVVVVVGVNFLCLGHFLGNYKG